VAEAAQAAMNGIWNVPRRRYPSFLLRRLRGLVASQERCKRLGAQAPG
jgi:hypothetical protein